MATSADDLFKQALELDEPERARLVTELLSTLEPDSATRSLSDSEWIAEIERRARAALAGRPGIPWDTARKSIEDRFDRE
jgi:Putative addiction module component